MNSTFTCDCGAQIPWPAKGEEITCPACGAVWEHDGIDIGGGARLKTLGDLRSVTGKTSPDGTRYCRTCGFTDCPSLTDGSDCPRWPVRGQAPLFGQLTPQERNTLAAKLDRAGHDFFESATGIARTAFYMEKTGRISALSGEWEGLWALRAPLVDAMDEMHALMAEVDDFARMPDA